MTITIAVDAMGGDFGPAVTVPAALKVAREQADLRLILVGDETTLRAALVQHDGSGVAQIEIQHASQVVDMDESPSQALRNKKDSSMRVAVNLVKEGRAGACVSAGNTGALMATARFVLKTLPGIDRPVLANALPTMKGHTHMLDLGANVDVTAEQLVQFAVMGAVLAEAVDGRVSPSVGLLNVGEEEIKGNEQVKEAAKRLAAAGVLNYAGFVEGDDIYKGTVDVVVCDGFVGNVALKTSEGVAKMITHFMRQSFARNWLTKAIALLAMPVLRDFRQRIDPGRYNGASLLGLAGIVVKSHGGADTEAFAWAIRGAVTEAIKAVPQRISDRVASLLVERQAL